MTRFILHATKNGDMQFVLYDDTNKTPSRHIIAKRFNPDDVVYIYSYYGNPRFVPDVYTHKQCLREVARLTPFKGPLGVLLFRVKDIKHCIRRFPGKEGDKALFVDIADLVV